jgi:hypothetical protein
MKKIGREVEKAVEGTMNFTKNRLEDTRNVFENTVEGTKNFTKNRIEDTRNVFENTVEGTMNFAKNRIEDTYDGINYTRNKIGGTYNDLFDTTNLKKKNLNEEPEIVFVTVKDVMHIVNNNLLVSNDLKNLETTLQPFSTFNEKVISPLYKIFLIFKR